jgi:type II secretory pathway pseudopilin PulG
MKTRAISLIEVMASITIIAVLFAILLPVFRPAKQRATLVQTWNDLKQYHVALHLYESDHGEFPDWRRNHPGLITYFGGKYPRPVYSAKESYKQHLDGYLHTGLPNAFHRENMIAPQMQLDLKCLEERGGAIPLVQDRLYRLPTAAAAQQLKMFPFIRLNGSISSEDTRYIQLLRTNSSAFPCPGASTFLRMR